jgi:hypothetical protein
MIFAVYCCCESHHGTKQLLIRDRNSAERFVRTVFLELDGMLLLCTSAAHSCTSSAIVSDEPYQGNANNQ